METTEHFLLRVISFLVHEPEFADQYLAVIPQKMFEAYPLMDRTVAALRFYKDSFKAYPEQVDLLEVAAYQSFSNFSPIQEGDYEELLDFFLSISENYQPTARGWVEQRLESELRRVLTLATLQEAANVLVQGSSFESKELREIIRRLEETEAIALHKDLGSSVLYGLADRWKRREREQLLNPRIPTGFGDFDTFIKGGVPFKSLCVLVARLGVGKTVGLIHLAQTALIYRFPVLFVTLEMPKEQIEDRFDAALTRTSVNSLLDHRAAVDELRKSFVPKGNEDIVIVEGMANNFTVAHLQHLLERLRSQKQFIPKLICLDYADYMLPAKSYTDRRFELENVYLDLKGLAKAYDLVIWTASQSNRAGGVAKQITAIHLADSDFKGQISDLVITINPQQQANVVQLFVAKNRLGPQNCKAGKGDYRQDLDKMCFIYNSPDSVVSPSPIYNSVVAPMVGSIIEEP